MACPVRPRRGYARQHDVGERRVIECLWPFIRCIPTRQKCRHGVCVRNRANIAGDGRGARWASLSAPRDEARIVSDVVTIIQDGSATEQARCVSACGTGIDKIKSYGGCEMKRFARLKSWPFILAVLIHFLKYFLFLFFRKTHIFSYIFADSRVALPTHRFYRRTADY